MKKIFSLLVLFCSLTAFVANAASVKSSYTGTLDVTVGSSTTTISNQSVFVTDNGNNTITLTIPDFEFAGVSGTVEITANISSTGELSNPQVSFSGITILRARFTSSFVTASSCDIHLSMYALGKNISVDFSGN